jgi:hypothetical protein
MVVLTVCGRGICRLLPQRGQWVVFPYLAPTFGLSVFVLAATGCGWIFGARGWQVLLFTCAALAWSLRTETDWAGLRRQLIIVLGTTVLISAGPLMTIWRYGGYNVYHDAFTYLVQAQWLQHHAFHEAVVPNVYQPAFTQVTIYQVLHLRMGGSFFFAWMQALSGQHWSIYVYPACISTALCCAAIAIGGLSAAIAPVRSRGVVAFWIAAAGTTIGGLTFGCFAGFMPQIFGLAFLTAFIGTLACLRVKRDSGGGRWQTGAFVPALLFSALGYAYSELLPFATLTLGLWFLVWLVCSKPRRQLLRTGAAFLAWSVVLLNVECIRIVKAILLQAHAVVGWPIDWAVSDFLGHILGIHSGVGDGDVWTMPRTLGGSLVLALVAWSVAVRVKNRRRRWPGLDRLLGAACFLALCLLGFLVFRYRVPSPWPTGTGQSWSQFKISNWSSPIFLGVLGAMILTIAGTRAGRILAFVVCGTWAALNLQTHYRMAPDRIAGTLRLTGVPRDPFIPYEILRARAVAANPPGVVFLDLAGSDHKCRQIAAYFLYDLKVAGDWTGDGYIDRWLPPDWQLTPMSASTWWVHRTAELTAGFAAAGTLAFDAMPKFEAAVTDVSGGHGRESDATGWWVWSPDQLEVHMKAIGSLPAEVRIRFTCIVTAQPALLSIRCRTRNGRELLGTAAEFAAGWQEYVSPSFLLDSSEADVIIRTNSAPVPIGRGDPRSAAFLAKNVRLELVLPPSK